MKKLIFILMLMPILATAQNYDDPQNMQVKYNQKAHHPNGDKAFMLSILQKLDYPESTGGKMIDGQIMVSFKVLTDSTVSDVVVLKEVGYGLHEQVVEMIKQSRFAPARANGEAIEQMKTINLPIRWRRP